MQSRREPCFFVLAVATEIRDGGRRITTQLESCASVLWMLFTCASSYISAVLEGVLFLWKSYQLGSEI